MDEFHECDKLKSSDIIIRPKDGKWLLSLEEYGDECEVEYCPLCGIKLFN